MCTRAQRGHQTYGHTDGSALWWISPSQRRLGYCPRREERRRPVTQCHPRVDYGGDDVRTRTLFCTLPYCDPGRTCRGDVTAEHGGPVRLTDHARPCARIIAAAQPLRQGIIWSRGKLGRGNRREHLPDGSRCPTDHAPASIGPLSQGRC